MNLFPWSIHSISPTPAASPRDFNFDQQKYSKTIKKFSIKI